MEKSTVSILSQENLHLDVTLHCRQFHISNPKLNTQTASTSQSGTVLEPYYFGG